MPNDFSVFISHRAEDRFLARLLKARLEYLSSLDGQRSVKFPVARNGGSG